MSQAKETNFRVWLEKHDNLIKAIVAMMMPLLLCILRCALQGEWIGNVDITNSEWNDELFYFKQVECILEYGYPQGYFGFNESHAMYLSFAAWSPVLLFPWIIWGLLFGWNLMSPIWCNIVVMMLTVFVFVRLVKPNWKQVLTLTVLFAVFSPMTRFMLSAMPEVLCFAVVITELALAINYAREAKNWKLVCMLVLVVLMTLMRPYLLMFIIFPAYFWLKKNVKAGSLGIIAVIGITGVIYFSINHFLSAEYLTPLFDTTWVDVFLTEGFGAGVKNMCSRLWRVGANVKDMLLDGIFNGFHIGTQYAGFLILMLIFMVQSVMDWKKKKYQELHLHFSMVICFVGMLVALFLMYKPREGGRHLLTFIAVGIFVLSITETKYFRKAIVTAVTFGYLYVIMAIDPYECQVPFVNEERQAVIAQWEELLAEEMILDEEAAISYDNTIIWTLWDAVGDTRLAMKWQELYAVPKGFGISCCDDYYVKDHFSELKSRYLAIIADGMLEEMCTEAGLDEIGRSKEVIIYRLR